MTGSRQPGARQAGPQHLLEFQSAAAATALMSVAQMAAAFVLPATIVPATNTLFTKMPEFGIVANEHDHRGIIAGKNVGDTRSGVKFNQSEELNAMLNQLIQAAEADNGKKQ